MRDLDKLVEIATAKDVSFVLNESARLMLETEGKGKSYVMLALDTAFTRLTESSGFEVSRQVHDWLKEQNKLSVYETAVFQHSVTTYALPYPHQYLGQEEEYSQDAISQLSFWLMHANQAEQDLNLDRFEYMLRRVGWNDRRELLPLICRKYGLIAESLGGNEEPLTKCKVLIEGMLKNLNQGIGFYPFLRKCMLGSPKSLWLIKALIHGRGRHPCDMVYIFMENKEEFKQLGPEVQEYLWELVYLDS